MKENIAFTLVLAVATATVACAQQSSAEKPADRPQVLVLGVYHMANRGHDIYNMHADDVLTPKRQAEIAQVIEVLRKFNPTKIAVEADLLSPTNPTTNERPSSMRTTSPGSTNCRATRSSRSAFAWPRNSATRPSTR
jgi:hypothetical protein